MKHWVLATHNDHKCRELAAMLQPYGIKLQSLKELGIREDIEETGATFAENAFLKANFASTRTGLPALADDSGLCVDALNGAPGVHTARYGGVEMKGKRNDYLLSNMVDITNRKAQFVCSLCLILPYQPPVYFEGICEGEIARESSGQNGFGYDPVFYLRKYHKTMADIPESLKNEISHRALAVAALLQYVKENL